MLPTPKPRSFIDPQVLARLAGLPLLARRPMQGAVSGRHPSAQRGASVEFAEYRKYVPGDDLRRLDWRAYGRSDRFYVKEFEADTNLRCCLVLDTSGSMGFGSGAVNKIQYARQLTAALSYLAVQQGDAVGLSCVAEGLVQSIPPRRNPAHLMHLFDVLGNIKTQGKTCLVPVLHELAETLGQRALVVILSDFFVETQLLRDCFEHLRFRKHDVTALQLLDPLELDFQFRRPMRFLDLEGGGSIFAEPTEIADRYHRALRDHLQTLRQVMMNTSMDYHQVRTDEDYEQVLVRLLVGRSPMRGRR